MQTRALLDTWVHDVGYSNEKLHAGILQRMIQRAEINEQRAVLAALWSDAAGEELPNGPIRNVKVKREAPLDRSRLRLDLLISFCVAEHPFHLGIELKVDSRPDAQQIADEWRGLALECRGTRHALVLLCLGTSQVCHCVLPTGVRRWSVRTLLNRRECLGGALPDDPVVTGWLNCLELEEHRRVSVFAPQSGLSDTDRRWSGHAYWLGCLQQALTKQDMLCLAPWHTKIHANGPVITAEGSRRNRDQDGVRLRVLVELNWNGLYVKVAAQQDNRTIDPRPFTRAFIDKLQAVLHSSHHAVRAQPARFKLGKVSSVLRIEPGPKNAHAPWIQQATAVDRVWDELTRMHGWLPERP